MKAKLENYRVFYEVATQLSFSRASERLFISQPAISQSIKQLETTLGSPLFRRVAKGVLLTPEGHALLAHVKVAMESLDVAEKKLHNMRELEEGSLIIGAGDTLASNVLLPYLETFHSLYPHIHLQVFNRTSIEMVDLVKRSKVDIAFVNLPIKDRDIHIHPCRTIHDVFVCGKNTPLKKSYTRADITTLPLILLERHSNSRQYVDQQFKKNRLSLHPQIELGAHELLLQFASIHLGVSCVVKEFSQSYIDTHQLQEINLIPPLTPRSIGYIHHKRMPLSMAAQQFISLIKAS